MDGIGGLSSSSGKLVVQFSEKDLLCKNDCGFYGNPQWQGFCSKCWREYSKHSQSHSAAGPNKKKSSSSDNNSCGTSRWTISSSNKKNGEITSPSKPWPTFGFDKFLEKKNQQSNRRSTTLRSILKKSPSSDCAQSASNSYQQQTGGSSTKPVLSSGFTGSLAKKPVLERRLSADSLKARESFFTFARTLPKSVASELTYAVKLVVDKCLVRTDDVTIDELSELVQDLYQTLGDQLRLVTAGDTVLPCSSEDVLNEVERYMCTRCYNTLFCSSTDEEVADLSLQDRIRSLHWVTYGFLDSGIVMDNKIVRDSFDEAVTEIIEMNSKRDPQEKLNHILQCSKLLFEALKESRNGQPASADEFLPALIYVILKSNPPMLQSNINFIARFALPIKLMSGEAGYYFTNLCCAMNFVQNLNADSLKMPREEFEAYTSGLLCPPLPEVTGRCHEAIKSLESSLEEVKLMRMKADQLSNDLDQITERQCREWDDLIAKTRSLNQAPDPGSVLSEWLDNSPDNELTLPTPLVPSAINADTDTPENQ